jgi:hypothetical protein
VLAVVEFDLVFVAGAAPRPPPPLGVEAEEEADAVGAAVVAAFCVVVPDVVVLSALDVCDAASAGALRANVAANAAAPALPEKRRVLMYVKPTLSLSCAYGVS